MSANLPPSINDSLSLTALMHAICYPSTVVSSVQWHISQLMWSASSPLMLLRRIFVLLAKHKQHWVPSIVPLAAMASKPAREAIHM